MFPDLPPFVADEALLRALAQPGGICDCGDAEDTAEALGDVAAGWPLFGQFVGHDITADRSAIGNSIDPGELRNARMARLDLEGLYGDGPVGHPFLYQRDDPAKFLLGPRGGDFPRNAEEIAIIGDPRNDSHLLIMQLHLCMMRSHNALVDAARRRHIAEHEVFACAVRELRWHYQRVIVNEFLPSLIGQTLVDDLLHNEAQWFRPDAEVFIPLEFADAVFRYGHCQIRQRYQLSEESTPVPLFPDLLGFRTIPPDFHIDWHLFFDVEGVRTAQRAKKIDGRLPRPLIQLPVAITGTAERREYHSLAARDLQRGHSTGLPSGEAVARHVGETPLTADEIGLRATGWKGETPLWYYILRESAVRADGNQLGPIGGRIVGEVIVTLLERDPTSVCFAPPDWRDDCSLIDLLRGL